MSISETSDLSPAPEKNHCKIQNKMYHSFFPSNPPPLPLDAKSKPGIEDFSTITTFQLKKMTRTVVLNAIAVLKYVPQILWHFFHWEVESNSHFLEAGWPLGPPWPVTHWEHPTMWLLGWVIKGHAASTQFLWKASHGMLVFGMFSLRAQWQCWVNPKPHGEIPCRSTWAPAPWAHHLGRMFSAAEPLE